jgi:hypothetical protein
MQELTQLVSDPNVCTQLQSLQSLDLQKYIGLAGAPVVEQAVQYLKEQWGLSTKLAPLASLGLGVAINVGLSMYLGLSLADAISLGAATGLLASGWYVVTK